MYFNQKSKITFFKHATTKNIYDNVGQSASLKGLKGIKELWVDLFDPHRVQTNFTKQHLKNTLRYRKRLIRKISIRR